jgi:hypothetical protein
MATPNQTLPGEECVPRFMVESYPVGFSADELTAASNRVALVAEEYRLDGIDVRLVESTLVPAEDSLFCIFEAPSREVVEEVAARAALPIERLIEAIDVGPASGHH